MKVLKFQVAMMSRPEVAAKINSHQESERPKVLKAMYTHGLTRKLIVLSLAKKIASQKISVIGDRIN